MNITQKSVVTLGCVAFGVGIGAMAAGLLTFAVTCAIAGTALIVVGEK